MRVGFKNSVRAILNRVANTYRQVVFCTRWVIFIGATCLVWGGALWFGSLAWDQKQGAVLALMGFVGRLAVCRFVLPGFWIFSIEVIKRFFQYIEYRFL